jgi:translation elongation factor EF-Ts
MRKDVLTDENRELLHKLRKESNLGLFDIKKILDDCNWNEQGAREKMKNYYKDRPYILRRN